MKYKLYQIKDWENNSYIFRGFNTAQKYGFNLKDYEVVYSGEVPDDEIEKVLEDFFTLFNVYHPQDFTGRSMSISDIVELDGEYYYTESFGFKKITEFCL